jgi:hypothetical protein
MRQPRLPAQLTAALGARLRELRWKNSAWLATAETIAGWNGFEIRKAGSGRSPVRKRSDATRCQQRNSGRGASAIPKAGRGSLRIAARFYPSVP